MSELLNNKSIVMTEEKYKLSAKSARAKNKIK